MSDQDRQETENVPDSDSCGLEPCCCDLVFFSLFLDEDLDHGRKAFGFRPCMLNKDVLRIPLSPEHLDPEVMEIARRGNLTMLFC